MIDHSKLSPWEQMLFKDRTRIDTVNALKNAQDKLKAEGLAPIPKNELVLTLKPILMLSCLAAGVGAFCLTIAIFEPVGGSAQYLKRQRRYA